jgi:hypothetical protein
MVTPKQPASPLNSRSGRPSSTPVGWPGRRLVVRDLGPEAAGYLDRLKRTLSDAQGGRTITDAEAVRLAIRFGAVYLSAASDEFLSNCKPRP